MRGVRRDSMLTAPSMAAAMDSQQQEQQEEGEEEGPLLALPPEVLAIVVQQARRVRGSKGHPLFGVASAGRDAVLR